MSELMGKITNRQWCSAYFWRDPTKSPRYSKYTYQVKLRKWWSEYSFFKKKYRSRSSFDRYNLKYVPND
jgi:hypothetical protein